MPILQELDKARCGILIGSAFGGMTSFATAVEALETSSESRSCSSGAVCMLCWLVTLVAFYMQVHLLFDCWYRIQPLIPQQCNALNCTLHTRALYRATFVKVGANWHAQPPSSARHLPVLTQIGHISVEHSASLSKNVRSYFSLSKDTLLTAGHCHLAVLAVTPSPCRPCQLPAQVSAK